MRPPRIAGLFIKRNTCGSGIVEQKTITTNESINRKMEEKKLKEIEARLNQLLKENEKSQKPETRSSPVNLQGVEVIRRRKGHRDLHIA